MLAPFIYLYFEFSDLTQKAKNSLRKSAISKLEGILKILRQGESTDITKSEKNIIPYESLSPIENTDSDEYINALEWALSNRHEKGIRNIALTGTYGSGKSSVLKSFQKIYKGKYQFLNISLATFKDTDAIVTDEKLRLIETSILQQMFYHEHDKNIPDSRFKKIKNFKRKELVIVTVVAMLFIIALLFIFYPLRFQGLSTTFDENIKAVKLISYLITLSCASYITFKLSRFITSLAVEKIKVKDAELNINNHSSKSVFNNFLDEVMYFFEVTPYNVLILEDLDRFKRTEIFTKLREINFLLNMEIPRNVTTLFRLNVTTFFRSKVTTTFRGKLTT